MRHSRLTAVKTNTTIRGWRRTTGLAAALVALIAGAPAARAQAPLDTLARIAETHAISIGVREDASPFSYRNSDGKVIGYSVDLCYRVIERLRDKLRLDHIKVTEVPATAATRFVLVKSGRIDLECTTTTNTAERREQVAFGYPHFFTATRFVSKKTEAIAGIAGLKGRTVVSTTGTINVEQLNALNLKDNLNISVLLAKRHSDAFAMVEQDKASAFVMDGILLAALVASSATPDAYVISNEAFGPSEPYGILMRKDDEPFKKAVGEALRAIYQSAEIKALYDKWFMSPIPPFGHNLRLPMSPEMQAEFADPHEYTY